MAVQRDGSSGPDQVLAELGRERRRGRRPRGGDPLGGLFATEVRPADLDQVYVKPEDDYERAREALTTHRLVLLQGRPGSGRGAMARHLLVHSLNLERIETVPVVTELGRLAPRQKRSGHLLERYPPERAARVRSEALDTDGATLNHWEGYLVVTVDDDVPVPGDETGLRLVACTQVPNARLVLERHLEHYLRDRGGLRDEDRAWLHGDTVAVHLARHGGLAETVRLARELAGHLADPPVPDRHRRLDRLLDAGPAPAPPAAPAARARRLLQCSPDVGHWSQVIALAVFDGNRPQVVADAAGRLARRLAPADPRADSAWPPAPVRRCGGWRWSSPTSRRGGGRGRPGATGWSGPVPSRSTTSST